MLLEVTGISLITSVSVPYFVAKFHEKMAQISAFLEILCRFRSKFPLIMRDNDEYLHANTEFEESDT